MSHKTGFCGTGNPMSLSKHDFCLGPSLPFSRRSDLRTLGFQGSLREVSRLVGNDGAVEIDTNSDSEP
jgi:hypothetical protein